MLKNNLVRYTTLFVMLILLQVLVLNRISFLGYAIPFFYIYFIIKLPIGTNRGLIAFLGFLLGLSIDIFTNTLGINAAATTFAAFFCRPIQGLFFVLDDYKEQTPRLSILGGAFMKYAVFVIALHNAALVSIEAFSYFNIEMVLYRIFLSTAITSVLVFAFESVSIKRKKSWEKTT